MKVAWPPPVFLEQVEGLVPSPSLPKAIYFLRSHKQFASLYSLLSWLERPPCGAGSTSSVSIGY